MINSRAVIAIVPKLPPAIDGVGDYALNIARQLRKDFNIQTHFIVGDPTWAGTAEIEGFTVSQVNSLSSNALISTLLDLDSIAQDNTPVLLHYVGYGYAMRGCPNWLVDGLQQWKGVNPSKSLSIMFHEISASGRPPWTSAFWLSFLQKRLAARLVKISNRCITSKQLYSDIIKQMSKGKLDQVPYLPVFSNVGEPDGMLTDLSQREPRVVIFGGNANRARVYQESHQILSNVCEELDIQEIWDVGTSTKVTPKSIGKIPIVEAGKQSANFISDLLATSQVGFFDYNPDYLAKSTIFSAYCAHRILPINAQSNFRAIDGITAGKHYWSPVVGELRNGDQLQSIANNAYEWYSQHNLATQSETFFHTIFEL
jgi:hypothetical protein